MLVMEFMAVITCTDAGGRNKQDLQISLLGGISEANGLCQTPIRSEGRRFVYIAVVEAGGFGSSARALSL